MRKSHTYLLLATLLLCLVPGAIATGPCEEWVAKVVSVQGSVQAKSASSAEWLPVKMNDTLCLGDMIRTQELSRAAILLPNEACLRLDQKTTITFNGLDEQNNPLIDLVRGIMH